MQVTQQSAIQRNSTLDHPLVFKINNYLFPQKSLFIEKELIKNIG